MDRRACGLQSMRLQRVRHDLETEHLLQQYIVAQKNINVTNFCCVCAKLLQLCLTLFDPMDCNIPGFSVHGILQVRILEWVATPFCFHINFQILGGLIQHIFIILQLLLEVQTWPSWILYFGSYRLKSRFWLQLQAHLRLRSSSKFMWLLAEFISFSCLSEVLSSQRLLPFLLCGPACNKSVYYFEANRTASAAVSCLTLQTLF